MTITTQTKKDVIILMDRWRKVWGKSRWNSLCFDTILELKVKSHWVFFQTNCLFRSDIQKLFWGLKAQLLWGNWWNKLTIDFNDYSVNYFYPSKVNYRLMQEFSIDWVVENFVHLQISTKNTTACDGVLDLVFTKPPQSDTCAQNRRRLDSCELMDGLPLDESCVVRCPCPQNCEKLIKVTANNAQP